MRYTWKKNELIVAARHPSISRYLGRREMGFPGQSEKHFRLILAEIVSDAVCSRTLSHNIERDPDSYRNPDWDMFYNDFSRYMTQLLPKLHKLFLADSEM